MMFSLSTDRHAAALEIMARSGANNFCLFLFDAQRRERAVSFLVNYGMSERICADYTARLWVHDPFLMSVSGGDGTLPQVVERRQLEEGGGSALPYWHYIDRVGYREIVAAIHPFSANLHLVCGLMGQRRRNTDCRVDSGRVMGALEQLASDSAGELLTSLTEGFFAEPSTVQGDGIGERHLTSREREVVQALQAGYSNKQIAAALALSEYTVENHFKRLFRKFNVHNRTALLSCLRTLSLI